MRYELRRLDTIGTLLGNHPNHYIRHIAVNDAILRCMPKTVLVLGCGTGLIEYLLPGGIHCTSLDISAADIETAKQINRHKPNRSFSVGNLYDVAGIINGTRFDLVSISEVLEHLPDDRQALALARSALKPGGKLVLTVPNDDRLQNRLLRLRGSDTEFMDADHKREYTIAQIRKLLADTGFHVIRWRGVYFGLPRPYLVERFASPYSALYRVCARLFPRFASYLLLTCRPD